VVSSKTVEVTNVSYEKKIVAFTFASLKAGTKLKNHEFEASVIDLLNWEKERLEKYLSDIYNDYDKETGMMGNISNMNPAMAGVLGDVMKHAGVNPGEG